MNSTHISILAGFAYLLGGVLVFVFGSSYFHLFRTNRSWTFKLALIAASGIGAWLLLRTDLNPACGLLAVAFLAASSASVAGAAVGRWIHRPSSPISKSVRSMGLAKGLEALTVVGAILAVLAVYRVPFSFAYLTTGRLGLGLGIGFGGFTLFAVAAWIQGRQLKIRWSAYRPILPWVVLFVFANGFMEELWFRAIFLGSLESLVGVIPAIALTAAVFAVSHIGATYMKPRDRLGFLATLFPLGLVWAISFHFTGSIIAAAIFHAGADLMVINGFVASYQSVNVKPDSA